MTDSERSTFHYSGNQTEAGLYIGADGKPGDPIISRYDGQTCEVIRPLTAEEADLDETGPMFAVRFSDGYVGEAFADELGEAMQPEHTQEAAR